MWEFYSLLPILFVNSFGAEIINPCPEVLKYVTNTEPNQLTAIIQLRSRSDFDGVFLRIGFNCDQIVSVTSDFGKFITTDNKTYTLVNEIYVLQANVVRPVMIKVAYNPGDCKPSIIIMKLNGRTICKEVAPKPKPVEENTMIQCRTGKVPRTLGKGFVEKGHYQWLAAIYAGNSDDLNFKCVGSLINKDYIVTNAYCAYSYKKETIRVYFGKQYGGDLTSPGVQERRVTTIMAHVNFTGRNNDIALFKLDNPVNYTDYVYPICIWDTDPYQPIYKPGVVVGWELEFATDTKAELKSFQSYIIEKEDCIDSDPETFKSYYKDKTYCGGFLNYTFTKFPCLGSAGSSMIFRSPNSERRHPLWMLRGFFSARGDDKCDVNHYILFTDVAKFSDWIFSAIFNGANSVVL